MSPPTVGCSFGSFGDIVVVLQLAWKLRAALDDSAGASAEIRTLVRDVDAFTRALQDVQANVERRGTNLRPDVVNGIAVALSRCRDALSAIQQRIERARGQTSGSGWSKYWGTAAWSILGGKKDVEALRARLSDQLRIMQLYLSLSEANSQERVQDVLFENGTTLQRIYTVVQDIQLRFDVGVPGFRFYDRFTDEYYLPLARTSLQRLSDVFGALQRGEDDLSSVLSKYYGIAPDDFRDRTELPASVELALNFNWDGSTNNYGYVTQFFFFRERAFGEWQVLVGARYNPNNCNALKAILERGHTVGVECNCPSPCTTRFRGYFDELTRRNEVCQLYSEAVSLIFERLESASPETDWLDVVVNTFFNWPELEPLRAIMPTLRQERLSVDDMVALIAKVPKSLKRPDSTPVKIQRDFIGFPVLGAALTGLLVGHAVPSHGSLEHEVHAPSWGYMTTELVEGHTCGAFTSRFRHKSAEPHL